MRFLGKDSRAGHRLRDVAKAETLELQNKLDAISKEHGEDYINGIKPVFEPLKARHFNSAFNWVRQDALCMFYDIMYVFSNVRAQEAHVEQLRPLDHRRP
jgi:3-oxoacyl-ACP reductase-like protein